MFNLSIEEIARIGERIEAEALESLQSGVTPDLAERLGVAVHHVGPAVAAVVSSVDAGLLNRVMGLGIDEPATEAQLDQLLELYGRAGVGFMVQVSPIAQPPPLPQWLEARGIKRRDNWVRTFRGVDPPPPVQTDLRVEQIGPEYGQAFGEINCTSFGLPFDLAPWLAGTIGREGWRHYMAFDGDMPASAAALFVKGEVGWLGIASTLYTHRRLGAQGALFARRIEDARALGCRWLTTETWEETGSLHNPSYHNMLRMGFELVYTRPNYIYGIDD